jgi:translocation and assembly module TamA
MFDPAQHPVVASAKRRRSDWRAALWVWLLAWLGAGISHAAIEIEVTGVDAELRRNVLAFLSLERYKNRANLDEALLERLQERAETEAIAALRPFGFYEAAASVDLQRVNGDAWRARVDIIPGKPVTIGTLVFKIQGEGRDDPAFKDLLKNPGVTIGQRLNHARYQTLKDQVQRIANNHGFAEARLLQNELLIDTDNYAATISLVMDTGPRYHFGSLAIEQRSIRDELLRRYLRFEEAQPFDANQLLRSQFALDDSQYFANVEVLAGEPDAARRTIPVKVIAEPNRRNRYSVGAGYATDSRARGSLSWENRRLNNRGHRFRAELKAAQVEQSFEARYFVPIGDPALERLGFELSYARDELGDLDTRTTRFQPSVTQVRGDWQRVAFVALDRVRTLTDGSATRLTVEESSTLLIPGISFTSIPRGYLGEALFSRSLFGELRGSSAALGAVDDFLQVRLEAERVLNVAKQWHVLLRGQVGATVIGKAEDLPGTERFFAGGDRSVRGFGFAELSPLNDEGAKIGGRHLLTGTVELIRDLPRNLALAVFFDIGNAIDDFNDPLQYSAGIGLRFRLPVVTIGVDIAQPLTNPICRSVTPDPRCALEPGFDSNGGPRLHLNFSPKL